MFLLLVTLLGIICCGAVVVKHLGVSTYSQLLVIHLHRCGTLGLADGHDEPGAIYRTYGAIRLLCRHR